MGKRVHGFMYSMAHRTSLALPKLRIPVKVWMLDQDSDEYQVITDPDRDIRLHFLNGEIKCRGLVVKPWIRFVPEPASSDSSDASSEVRSPSSPTSSDGSSADNSMLFAEVREVRPDEQENLIKLEVRSANLGSSEACSDASSPASVATGPIFGSLAGGAHHRADAPQQADH
jgi:hypothetical protein